MYLPLLQLLLAVLQRSLQLLHLVLQCTLLLLLLLLLRGWLSAIAASAPSCLKLLLQISHLLLQSLIVALQRLQVLLLGLAAVAAAAVATCVCILGS
jgi:hypothetical protein